MIRVFKSKNLIEALQDEELDQLVKDFKAYKSGSLPDLFGRDELYDHPHNLNLVLAEQVRHIHLAGADNPWHIHKLQFYRTSSEHLVYCRGSEDENCYLLMAILGPKPDAHDLARDNNIMYKLGRMAELFRSKY